MNASDFMDKPESQSLLESLLQEAERANDEKELAEREAWQALLGEAVKQVETQLPGWSELKVHAGKGTYSRPGDGTCEVTWCVDAYPLGLAKFYVISRSGKRQPGVYLSTVDGTHYNYNAMTRPDGLGAFLFERRREYQEREKRQREKDIQEQAGILQRVWNSDTYEMADQALAALNKLAPDDAGEWERLYKAKVEKLDYWQRYQAELEQIKAQQQAEADAYEIALRAYFEQVEVVRTRREQMAREAQAKLDEFELTVYRLTYAQVAMDDEDENYLDTEGAWVTSDQPDADGYFTVVKHGKEIPTKFYHPIKIEGPFVHRAGHGKDTAHRVSILGELDLWELPGQNAMALIADLPEYPERPERPEWMDHWAAGEIERRARDNSGGSDGRLE